MHLRTVLEVSGTPPGTWGLRALEAYLVPWKEDVR